MTAPRPDDRPPAQYARTIAAVAGYLRGALKAGGQAVLHVLLLDADSQITDIIASPLSDQTERDLFAETVRQRASRQQARAAALVSEAWALRVDRGNYAAERQADKYPTLEHHPKRMDIVAIQLETRDGHWFGQAEIFPAKKGRKFGPITWIKSEATVGRFTHFLPIQYATPERIAAAMATLRAKLAAGGVDPDYRMPSGVTTLQMLEQHARQAPADRINDAALDQLAAGMIQIWHDLGLP